MRIRGQVSLEFLMITLALILYVGAWFLVAQDIVGKTQEVILGWEKRMTNERIQRSVNMMCMGAGRIEIESDEILEVEGGDGFVSVNGANLPVRCQVDGKAEGKRIIIEKADGGVIIHG